MAAMTYASFARRGTARSPDRYIGSDSFAEARMYGGNRFAYGACFATFMLGMDT